PSSWTKRRRPSPSATCLLSASPSTTASWTALLPPASSNVSNTSSNALSSGSRARGFHHRGTKAHSGHKGGKRGCGIHEQLYSDDDVRNLFLFVSFVILVAAVGNVCQSGGAYGGGVAGFAGAGGDCHRGGGEWRNWARDGAGVGARGG